MKSTISLLDIVGPVMIGPSSSHTAGAVKIGLEAYTLLGEMPEEITIKLYNSYSDTGKGHKTDVALLAGAIGLSPEDPDVINSPKLAEKLNVRTNIKWGYHSSDFHPNTAIVRVKKGKEQVSVVGYSIGGGSIFIAGSEKKDLSIKKSLKSQTKETLKIQKYNSKESLNKSFYTFEEIRELLKKKKTLLQIFLSTEEETTGLSKAEILNEFERRWNIMKESVKKGVAYRKRSCGKLYGGDSNKMLKSKYNLLSKVVEDGITYSIGVAELNAQMGKIVAAPTAGSCGIIPGTLLALQEKYKLSDKKLAEALVIAAGCGAIVANVMELAGAVGGCQAEIGVAGGMAAAGGVYLMGGNIRQIEASQSLVYSNLLGLTCDPVMGQVEVPCIIRNGMVTSMVFGAIEMAVDNIAYPINLDEIIQVMKEVGKDMHLKYKETSTGGLAKTQSAVRACHACNMCG